MVLGSGVLTLPFRPPSPGGRRHSALRVMARYGQDLSSGSRVLKRAGDRWSRELEHCCRHLPVGDTHSADSTTSTIALVRSANSRVRWFESRFHCDRAFPYSDHSAVGIPDQVGPGSVGSSSKVAIER